MQYSERILEAGTKCGKCAIGAVAAFGIWAILGLSAQANERPLFVSMGESSRAPIGWVEFCSDQPQECAGRRTAARDVVLTTKAWKDLARVNKWVNETIRPVTDLEQWGVVEKWSYPDTGRGDCEDYVLLKRRMLIQAGWPREALLITVVRERNGDGHAVLTVKTDKGEFILDNQNEEILLWSATNYRFVKRQSQQDPNVWVALGDPRPTIATATSSR
ncbi:MAG: transglutaminase-like cysteine peptidase [Pseudorhodoplanes sp.]|jgi:predicted transglutaminase-like cysteine proteinase|nr:transglutaminase-like cysteine peptidase [Pseudorhodoplanes sp.]